MITMPVVIFKGYTNVLNFICLIKIGHCLDVLRNKSLQACWQQKQQSKKRKLEEERAQAIAKARDDEARLERLAERYLERRNETHPIRWVARIGLATGPVIGSVVGVQKYIYDVFGPAVERASRTRSLAPAMSIAAHASIRDLLDSRFTLSPIVAKQTQSPKPDGLFLLTETAASEAPGRS